ncbi:hypothetical protein ACN47E_004471 [Coniothyrium glycines]
MRLLSITADGGLECDEFDAGVRPAYAILSHTWLEDNRQEVTFQDLASDNAKDKAGYSKITFCARQARQDGLHYFWVDTCCIDKTNSVELQEAITSMFRWYQEATKCYVYLSDVSVKTAGSESDHSWELQFGRSRWFTRGWTLQELLAPDRVDFFSKEGDMLGDRLSLRQQISNITDIPIEALLGRPVTTYNIMERFSWAKDRKTKRAEDRAYSLMGLLCCFIPIMYGEGYHNAQCRLLRASDAANTISSHLIHFTAGLESMAGQHVNDKEKYVPIVNQPPAITVDDIKKRIIKHLEFPNMTDREQRIGEAAMRTYEWVLQPQDEDQKKWTCFVQWLRGSDSLYWIEGKAGSGKSTLMKFLYQDKRTRSNLMHWSHGHDLVVAGHFFWNSGSSMQMSFEGLLRTLLYDVSCHKAISMSHLFAERWKELSEHGASGCTHGDEPWTTSEYLCALRKLLHPPFDEQRFFFCVDGLDEFDGDQTELVRLLKEMAASSHIKICAASRPWTVFRDAFNTGPSLTLQDLTQGDMRLYIEEAFKRNEGFQELQRGMPRIAKQLNRTIVDKASGVFLWVHLAVHSLLRGLDSGDRQVDLIRRLDELPEDLEALFRKILDSIDPAFREHSSQLFQIVRAGFDGEKGVTLLLLSYADDDDEQELCAEDIPLGFEEWLYRMKVMQRRLDSRTRGLLEAPMSMMKTLESDPHPDPGSRFYAYEHWTPTVQYLHRTLKDYLEQPNVWAEMCSAAPAFDPHLPLFRAYTLQLKSLDYCIRLNPHDEDEEKANSALERILYDASISLMLAKDSNWKQMLASFDAFIASYRRKMPVQVRTSKDYEVAWSLIATTLKSANQQTTSSTRTRSTKWRDIPRILTLHGADAEAVRRCRFERNTVAGLFSMPDD